MTKILRPLTKILLILVLIGFCFSPTLAFTPTFYRALNLNGAALSIDGKSWEASSGAANFSYTQTGGGLFTDQGIPLVPSTDANRATMIRSSISGNVVNLNVGAIPSGNYDVWVYVWEDLHQRNYSVSVEGATVLSNFTTGGAGWWTKLGPYRATITDGTLNISMNGDDANVSGIEIWTANNAPVVANAIPDQTASIGNAFTYGVLSNAFTDPDPNTTLTYTASLSNGNPLPAWLSFNPVTRSFTGTPGSGGSLNVRVTASDGELTGSDVFAINVSTVFYRALNLNGAALSIDGNNWEASSGAPNFTYSGGVFANQDVTLAPATDANRATMIRSSIWGNVNLNVTSVPNDSYDIYIYVWQDSSPETYSISVEGVVRLSNFYCAPTGSWNKLGPFRTVISDGAINISTTGGTANVSGLEIWKATVPGNQPPVITNLLLDQSATQGMAFSYAFPSYTFMDPNAGTVLTYTADQSNGSPLPSWLTFNSSTRTFSGTPGAAASGTFDIRVTASDGSGGTVSDFFTLSIASSGASEFYRGINLNGSALSIDGNNWQASSGNANFTFTTDGGSFANQGITLIPATDANRASMIRSSIYGHANLTISSIPTGTYDISVYVWEDTGPQTFSFSIEGAVAVSNYNSGAAGTWSKLGPFRKFIGDGAINISNLTWSTALSGVEIRKVTTADIPVSGISVSPSIFSLTAGQTGQLNPTITPSNATNQNITWASSNINIATVSLSGLVTAVAPGSATITATSVSGGFTATSTVNIAIPVTGISVSPSALTLAPGQTGQINKTIAPSNASNQSVTWNSSNGSVATVDNNGLVTAASSPGSATITATTVDGSFTTQTVITVEEIASVSNVIEKFAFQYKYDGRRRMTHKKLPGANWVYMVYDDRDRLVMTQDGNQRHKQIPEWTFTKYDALNRPILTGIYADTESESPESMQHKVNDFYAAAESNDDDWFELRGTVVHGYTNRSFPKINTTDDYLTVTYYGDYTFKTLITSNASEFEYDNTRLVASGNDKGQEEEEFIRVQGQVTGTTIKNLETDEWMWSVNYYDDRYRVIQTIADNSKGGLDKITNVYDFVGKVQRTKTDHTVTGANAMATTRKLSYDHAGRLLQTEHKTNNGTAVVIAKNDYNELGQLIAKKLHSTDDGANFKQHVDYRYNIRGWLTRINNSDLSEIDGGPKDYFGMELGYNNDIGVGGLTAQYNGNISAIKYSTNQGLGLNDTELEIFEPTERGYAFQYDPMNRLTDAAHREKTAAHSVGTILAWDPADAYHEGGLQYDLNGNIINLDRKGKAGADMDELVYHYNGNQLMQVIDAENTEEGFKDGNTAGDDYLYDDNGNMITDRNKDIDTITYNHLNLPSQVVKTSGERVKYFYNAAGVKLSQEVYDASNALKKKTDYLGEFFYENDTLKFINHEEGRIVMTGSLPEYQYTLKDHLGNSRITFTSKHEEETNTATLEDNTQTGEQNNFSNYSRVINDLLDHTDAGTVYDKVLVLNGGYNGQIGLAKSFAVVPGDTVKATVYAKYTGGTGASSNLANIASALTEAFGLTPNLPGEAATAFEALNAIGSVLAAGGKDDDDTAPKGFINILVFDKEYNLVDFSYEQIDAASVQTGSIKAEHQLLMAESAIRQTGYVYVFLSNEGALEQQIGFDDYSVTHSHSAVIQQDDYYPFGLTFNSYRRENSMRNQYLYNGKEIQDEVNLSWLDYGARMYMPEIGRWGVIDPLAERYLDLSPFTYVANRPMLLIDPNGAELWLSFTQEDEDGNETTTRLRYEGDKLYYEDGNEYDGSSESDPVFQFVKDQLNSIKEQIGDNAAIKDLFEYLEGSESGRQTIKIDLDTKTNKNDKDRDWFSRTNTTSTFNPLSDQDDDKKDLDPRVGLLHELKHAYDIAKGTQDYPVYLRVEYSTERRPLSILEIRAVNTENILRDAIYGDIRKTYNVRGKNVIIPADQLTNGKKK